MSWPTSEILYLYRGKDENDDIFVKSSLHQHHIDGIRFLYKQFRRKKPGVILNSPHGYGNSLQVTLFLGAIQSLLKKPILIMCEDGEEYNWLELFQKHTQSYDVVVNATNAFLKKSIFINNVDGVEMFTRRTWGVIVNESEGILKMKTLHPKFEADYKIWVTPIDMKEQLSTFSVIYKWIFPKEKFNPDEFKAKPGDRKDTVSKAILLANFFEDIVFRSKLLNPFENSPGKNINTQQKVSEKKKDVTGTKVKRSKRTAEEINNTNPDVSATKLPKVNNVKNHNSALDITPISLSNVSNSKSESDVTNIKDKHSDLDVETFIWSKKPIKNRVDDDDDNISNENEENNMVLHYSEKSISPEKYESNSAAKNGIVSQNRTIDPDVTMSPESDDNAYELETQEFLNDNNMETNDSEIKENNMHDASPKAENNLHSEDEITLNAQNVNSHSIDNEIDKESGTNILDENNDVAELKEGTNEEGVTKESKSIKTDTSSMSVDIDTKITEHEDRIFKKFKGTFLDSIF